MEYNTPNKPQNTFKKPDLGYNPSVSPVWAKLLYKGVSKRDKLQKGIEEFKDDPSELFKGLLGNSFLAKILPKSTKLDILEQRLKFKLNKNFNMTVGQSGGNPKMNLNWRF